MQSLPLMIILKFTWIASNSDKQRLVGYYGKNCGIHVDNSTCGTLTVMWLLSPQVQTYGNIFTVRVFFVCHKYSTFIHTIYWVHSSNGSASVQCEHWFQYMGCFYSIYIYEFRTYGKITVRLKFIAIRSHLGRQQIKVVRWFIERKEEKIEKKI